MPFAKWRRYQVGTGKARAGFSGLVVDPDIVAGASLIAAETTLNTVTLKANSLYKNGMALRGWSFGSLAANGNNKQIKAYLGAAAFFDSGTVTINDKAWHLEFRIVRLAAASQVAVAWLLEATGAAYIGPQITTLTQDETADLAITVKGTAATGAGDILSKGLFVEALTL